MAKLIPTTEEQWRLLRELFDDKRGIVFVSPEMSKRMSEEKLITADHFGEIDYNFGCDVMVDFINSEFSYAYRVAREQLAEGDEDVGLNNNSALGAKFEAGDKNEDQATQFRSEDADRTRSGNNP